MPLPAAITWYGGKQQLARRIDALLPKTPAYAEPFVGGGALLFHRAPSKIEAINDIDGDLINFYRVLRDPATAARFVERLELTPYSEREWRDARDPTDEPVERACRFYVLIRQSYSSGGGSWGYSNARNINGGICNPASVWRNKISGLDAIIERLSNVQIFDRSWFNFALTFNNANSLLYLDPPYLASTRADTNHVYQNEMMAAHEHEALLDFCRQSQAAIALSGYHSDLYDRALADWNSVDLETELRSAPRTGGLRKRIEVVWRNPRCMELVDPRLL